MWRAVLLLAFACSQKASKPQPVATASGDAPAGSGMAAADDRCTLVTDKLFAFLKRYGNEQPPGQREESIASCRKEAATKPNDPSVACVLAAKDDAAIVKCEPELVHIMASGPPVPEGEPHQPLYRATESLRTYFFVHETFANQKVPLTPAKPCCQFPTKKCPPEDKPNEILTQILMLDLSKQREFQYRFESNGNTAVVEAVGDRDCDGVTVTYRRDMEQRADGNMHITVIDPPEGSD